MGVLDDSNLSNRKFYSPLIQTGKWGKIWFQGVRANHKILDSA